MNSLFLGVLSLSLSGSLLILALLALRPLLRGRVSARWQYYAWLLVVLRLLLPWAPQGNLMERLFVGAQTAVSSAQGRLPSDSPAGADSTYQPTADEETAPVQANGLATTPEIQALPSQPPCAGTGQAALALWQELRNSLWVLWLAGAFALLVKKLSGYRAFLGYIRAGSRPITQGDLCDRYRDLCAEMKLRRPPALARNELAAAPMLVGVFRPVIVLPALDVDTADAALVLRHELIHYQRGDIFYKWLAQLAACAHWFNPLIYRLLRETGRDCELSCDEAVIHLMDTEEMFRYGETLLDTIKPDPGYSNAIVSITLNEDTKKLKERLDAIMEYKKLSRTARTGSALLAALLCVCALWTGAYAAPRELTPVEANDYVQPEYAVDTLQLYDSNVVERPGKTDLDSLADQEVLDYLSGSAGWQEFLAAGKQSGHQWPRYLADTYDGMTADQLFAPLYVYEDTEAWLTVYLESGDISVVIRNVHGQVVFTRDISGSGLFDVWLPASQGPYLLAVYGDNLHAELLLESGPRWTDVAAINGQAGDAEDTASVTTSEPNTPLIWEEGSIGDVTPQAYLAHFPYWEGTGFLHGWPYYLGLSEQQAVGESFGSVCLLTVDEPGSLILHVYADAGSVDIQVIDEQEQVLLQQDGIISARYRIILPAAGAYQLSCDGLDFTGKVLVENEAYNKAFWDTPLSSGYEITESTATAPTGKSTGADYAAYQVMSYSGSWEMVEYLLPYMTRQGIDEVVALSNQKHPDRYWTASNYYELPTPDRYDSDERCWTLCYMSGANWIFVEPLFPYMSNAGIDRVIAHYNRMTGNNLNARDYYN